MSYIPKLKGTKKRKGDGIKGRHCDPSRWKTGPNLHTREKYYAFLKHKSQAEWRGEDYELTWEDWQVLWPDELYARRGRSIDSLVLARKDWNGIWSLDNCYTCTRREHFKRKKDFRDATK